MHPDLETQPLARVRWATLQAQREVLMEVFYEAHRIGRAADFLKDPRVLPISELIRKRRPRPIVFFAFAVSRRVEADGCRELVRDYETRSL